MPDDLESKSAALRDRVNALAESVMAILDLDPLSAARSAPQIIDEAKSVMAAVRRSAIAAAAESMTHAAIAEGLGVSSSAVNNALVEHRARSASQPVGSTVVFEGGIVGV